MLAGVLVPVHGWAPYLAEALDAVLAQDPAPAAVVVVDDASPEPLTLHPLHAARCRLLRREARGGPAAARATGLDVLPPEIDVVALCDADDAWEPGLLAAHAEALAAAPAAPASFGRATIVGPDGRATGERWPEPGSLGVDELYAGNPIPTSSVAIRRAALAVAGGFAAATEVAEDWDLWLRLAATGGPLVAAGAARVRYRRHPGGLTADVARLAAAQLALHERHARRVPASTSARVIAHDRRTLRAARLRARLRRLAGASDPYR
jgi:glycosyltransferase involved in cell wall biosynthesis